MRGQAGELALERQARARARLDLAGVAIVGLSVLWVCVAAADRQARIAPMVLLLVAVVLAHVVGRAVGVPHPVTVPAVVACGIALALAVRSTNAAAVAPPLGYGNANGSLGVLGITAATMAAVSAIQPISRRAL